MILVGRSTMILRRIRSANLNRNVSKITFQKVTFAAVAILSAVRVKGTVFANTLTNSIMQQDTIKPTVKKNSKKLLTDPNTLFTVSFFT